MTVKYNEETGQYEEILPGGGVSIFFDEEEAKRRIAEQDKKASAFKKQQGLVGEATRAGYGLADVYRSGAQSLGKATQEGKTAIKQHAARSLMGPGADRGALGLAAKTGLDALMSGSMLEQQSIKDQTGLRASGQDAAQAAALFGLSADPTKMAQTAAMGYMSQFFEIEAAKGTEAAQQWLAAALSAEVNPEVVRIAGSLGGIDTAGYTVIA